MGSSHKMAKLCRLPTQAIEKHEVDEINERKQDPAGKYRTQVETRLRKTLLGI